MKTKKNKLTIYDHITNILLKWGFSKRGFFKNSKGEWYLLSQLLLISLHLLPSHPKVEYIIFPIDLFIIVTGIIISINGLRISLKAFIDLGDNLTPLAYPMKESILIRNNSYKNSRHPLYKGLLLISLGISISYLSIIHFALFISLSYVLKNKALKEEELLKIKFIEYKTYMREVPAIMENIKYLDWRI